MLFSFLLLIIGFVLLAVAADRLVGGAINVARYYQVSQLLIGVTLVALGTSLPEMVVGTYAAIYGNPQIALGNAIGSNIANIGLVLGLTILLIPIRIHLSVLRREFPMLFIVMALASLLMFDGYISRWDGLFLIVIMLLALVWLVRAAKKNVILKETLLPATEEGQISIRRSWFYIILGLILLPIASHITVDSATNIARYFGASDLVIGLTLVALGTSLPELATSIAGARKKHYDLIAGNILGSNIFNLLIVLALPAIIRPIPVLNSVLYRDLPVMFFITLLLFGLLYFFRRKGQLGRLEGCFLIAVYAIYLVILQI